MNKLLKPLAVAAGLAIAGTGALAEQTIGYQTTAVPASATAKVNVRVVVPKIVILRVGAADATVTDVTVTGALNPAVAVAGNSLASTHAISPAFGTASIARTNPAAADGVVPVAAWTNGSGATLSCALGALAGATAFASGATAAGVPGTNAITVGSVAGATNLQHPGANLSSCDGTTTTALTQRTTYGGSFTYGTTGLVWDTLNAGIYGNVVTYTASAP